MGRFATIESSDGEKPIPSVSCGKPCKSQPQLVSPFAHACTSGVTPSAILPLPVVFPVTAPVLISTIYEPSCESYCERAVISSANTPLSPKPSPKESQVELVGSHGT